MLFSLLIACSILDKPSQEEEKDPIKVDILIVMDNSASMWQEGAVFGLNLEKLLEEQEDQALDYQIGITTTSVEYTGSGSSDALEAGEAGLLIGNIITSNDDEPIQQLREQLLCDTVYWDVQSLLSPENQEPDYVCGDETENISLQYLDCLCGTNGWESSQGSGQEEPIEAALLAACRTKSSAPESCYSSESIFSAEDLGTNPALFRENTAALIILIGDEGDASRRVENGSSDVTSYQEAFQFFQKHNFTFVAFGPDFNMSTNTLVCNNGGATDWATQRFYLMSEGWAGNEGLYFPLETQNESGACELANFSEYLTEINSLMYDF